MSRTVSSSRFVLSILVLAFVPFAIAQRSGGGSAPRAATPQPIPDFSRLPDPTNQSAIEFQPFDKAPLTFTSRPIYVLVPVIVTGKDGKPVSGLRKEDFEIQENGKDQKVASLEELKPMATALPHPAAASSEITNRTPADVTPRRLVIIALDMVDTPFEDQLRSRRAMITYLSDNIEPDSLYQLVAVENNGLRILHDYTEDTASLVATLQGVRSKLPTSIENSSLTQRAGNTDSGPTAAGRPAEDPHLGTPIIAPSGSGREQGIAMFLSEVTLQKVRADEANAINSTLLALQQIAEGASGIPGRKSLIWITGSFPFSIDPVSASVNSGTSFEAYQHTMQLLEDQLISVYPVDARGLVTAQLDATTNNSARQMLGNTNLNRDMSNQLLDTQDTMRAFADMTGGRAYVNTNDTRGAIRDAVQDGSAYYMLSYAVDKSDRRQGWRKINVKVGDYHIRARHGYFLTKTTVDPLNTAKYDMDNALRSSLDYTGLPVKLTLNSPAPAGDKRKVTFAMMMPPKATKVDSDDKNHMHVDIAYAVWNSAGKDAAHKGTSYNLNLNPAQLQQIETNGLSYGDTLELPPGNYKLRLVVRDNLTGQIGSVSTPLDVK
jgi:VWFA-related protein